MLNVIIRIAEAVKGPTALKKRVYHKAMVLKV